MSGGLLLDVNVLIAMAWPAHRDHGKVQGWIAQHEREGWVTCPLTECAFVRILSNPAFSPGALTPADALTLLQANTSHPSHRFWEEDVSFVQAVERLGGRLTGHRQVSDAYLLGLVIHKKGRLVTMDRALTALLPEKSPERQRIVVL